MSVTDAKIQQVRHAIPSDNSNSLLMGAMRGLGGFLQRKQAKEVSEKAEISKLIPVLAQMKMLEPSKGQQGDLNMAGQGFNVTKPQQGSGDPVMDAWRMANTRKTEMSTGDVEPTPVWIKNQIASDIQKTVLENPYMLTAVDPETNQPYLTQETMDSMADLLYKMRLGLGKDVDKKIENIETGDDGKKKFDLMEYFKKVGGAITNKEQSYSNQHGY